jgi:hypothetical protein
MVLGDAVLFRLLNACYSYSMHPHILKLGTFTKFSVIFHVMGFVS